MRVATISVGLVFIVVSAILIAMLLAGLMRKKRPAWRAVVFGSAGRNIRIATTFGLFGISLVIAENTPGAWLVVSLMGAVIFWDIGLSVRERIRRSAAPRSE